MQFVTTLRTRMNSVFPGAIFASLLLLAAASASAQVFTDDFSYAAAAPLNGTGGWSAHSSAGTNPPSVTSPGLSYSGYAGSGIGNKINFITSGEDNNHSFTGITSGSAYASAMVNLSATQATGDYFFHMVDGPIAGNKFRVRLFAKKDPSSTNYAFGLQFGSTAGSLVYTGYSFVPGTTYFVVLKYTFVAGALNDPVALFINPVPGSLEPVATLTSAPVAGDADIAADGVAGVAIRQGSASNAATGSIDGIRVGTTWASVTPPSWDIVASSGANGTVTPSGTTTVANGANQIYMITPDPGYKVSDVLVDAGSVGAVTTYTFTNVTANHTISASFVPNVNLSVILDKARGIASSTTPKSDQQFTGYGSWYKKYPGAKAELYISPSADLGGASFKIDDIQSVTYHTYNVANPSPVEFFMAVYTAGTAHGWYEQRVNGEPYLKNGTPYAPVNNVWSAWTTTGTEALTLNDSNNSGNQGFYGAPTLADMQAGPITWSTWPGNPTAGSASATPIDYGAQTVFLLSFQTGSGWSGFEGYLDAITVTLKNGDVYNIDLEATPYTLTTNTVGNGSVSKSPDQPSYAGGAVVQLTATPDPGWAFAGWSGDATGFTNPLNVTMDDDKNITATFGTVTNTNTGRGYTTIQAAHDDPATLDGHTIHAGAGTYVEQVEVTKNVTISGDGCANTIIKSPASLPLSFLVGANPNKPVVYFHDVSDGRLQNLTVDGDEKGNANYRFIGVAYYNAGGKVSNVCVVKIEDSPFSGAQHGVGVYSNNTTGGPYSLELASVSVTDFQKTGIALNGAGMTVNVHDCTTVGKGATSVTAQNGIQISNGAGGTVANCAISEMSYTPATFVASGLLTFAAAPVNASGLSGPNAITNVQAPISWYDTNGSMDGIEVVGGADYGPIFVYNSSASAAIRSNASSRPVAAPFSDVGTVATPEGERALASYSVSVTNSCLNGTDVAGTVGIFAYTEGGPLSVDANHNEIHDWDYGLATYGPAATLTANLNSVSSNPTAGYDNTGSGAAQNAENNWWGAATGPSGAGPGTGDAVLGTGVDFTPFLHSSAEGSLACGFSPLPEISIGDVSMAEGAAGTTTFTFTVSLSHASAVATSVDWQVNDGTAKVSNNDYVDGSGNLSIPANTLSGVITVDVNGDLTLESNETFSVVLSNAVNGSILDGTGVGTIQNDDGAPSLSISDESMIEGTAGPGYVTFIFDVTLSNPTDQAVTVHYQSADGSATEANFDYVPVSGTLTIPAKTSSGTIEVIVPSDQTQESNETFFINLSNPTNATIADNQGVGTIQNDDGVPAISISDVSLTEGNAGLKDFTFSVTLSNASDQPITVTYQTQNNSAIAPGDFIAVGPTVLTIPSKNSLVTITIKVKGDVVFEGDETFFVNLSNPNGATIADGQGLGTIIEDEVTAVLLSMFEAATVTDGVELRWQFADATDVTSTWVERGPAVSGPWTRIVAEASVKNGVTVALDRTAVAGRTYAYRLVAELAGGRQVTFTPAEGTAGERVTEFALARVSPNPTTDFARIEYTIAREAKVRVSIVDLQGRVVADVVNGVQGAGRYQAVWNGEGARGRMPAGLYFVRFDAGGKTGTKRIMLTH